jgi:glycosyltransferase involved in cell wall biosynthesis
MSTSSTPEVSVVIPTRDRWPLLVRKGLPAACSQEGVELEVIVVDDSREPPPTRVALLEDTRVRVLRGSERRGVAAARNAGIAAARGEWIAFLDDDDMWSPEKLRRQLDAAHDTNADFVYSGVVSVDAAGFVMHEHPVPSPDNLDRALLARCVIPAGASNVLALGVLVREVGGFDIAFRYLADWDLWIRLAQAGRAAAAPGVLVAYLEQLDGMSLEVPKRAFRELSALEAKYRTLRKQHNVSIDSVAFMHDAAWLQLRRRRHGAAARIYLRSAIVNRRPRDVVPAVRFALRALVPMRRSLKAPVGAEITPAPRWLDV